MASDSERPPGAASRDRRPPMTELKTVQPAITCNAEDRDPFDEVYPCRALSRFTVTRSDEDTSYGSGGGREESCEAHLADAVLGMVDGDENVLAVVRVRWDEPQPGGKDR